MCQPMPDTVTRLEGPNIIIDLRPDFGDIVIFSQYAKEQVLIHEQDLGELLGLLDRAKAAYMPKPAPPADVAFCPCQSSVSAENERLRNALGEIALDADGNMDSPESVLSNIVDIAFKAMKYKEAIKETSDNA